ncbi:hypothetical protein [Flavobacterium cerinum]|uniref:Prolyl-tRNA synthetase n=1 Tax=Flavobacterium cerinum TaxID=2502784 RepID=A0ABY5IRS4_9FLAO|nr:hypothetical protein [Flavobacterium cerinum]UUC45505.1 hypothetical protein NOX80_18030 [Flavobacterium cerinum]
MKTYYLSSRKLSIYTVIGFFGLVVSSCGSYQNSSYYDHDGVYGSERPSREYNRYSEQNMAQANNYKDYFSDLQKDANNGVFTDVDNYSSQGQDSISNIANRNEYAGTTGYAGWGDSSSNITVNVYNNDPWYWNRGYWNSWYSPYYGSGWGWNNYYYGGGWGVSLGWGWNSWYGPNWGWGWNNWYGPGWGWGYGGGWYNGYYRNNRIYNAGPRGGSAYYNGRYNNSVYGYNYGTRNYNTSRRNVDFNATRNYGTGTRDYNNYNNGTRNYNNGNGTRNYNNNATRDYNNNNSGTRNYNNNNSGTRNYNYNNSNSGTRSNSNYSAPTRSYNSGGSFGGSRGGGSFGGGRSGGGGRR